MQNTPDLSPSFPKVRAFLKKDISIQRTTLLPSSVQLNLFSVPYTNLPRFRLQHRSFGLTKLELEARMEDRSFAFLIFDLSLSGKGKKRQERIYRNNEKVRTGQEKKKARVKEKLRIV